MSISRRDPRVRDLQRILGQRFGLASQIVVDGDLGPRTFNGMSMVLGDGWWALSPDGMVAALGARTTPALPAYPFPERVRIAQSILRVPADGFLGPDTWKALDVKLPSWKTRTWEASQPGNIPKALGSTGGEAAIASAPVIQATAKVAPDGRVDSLNLAAAMKKLRERGGADAAAAADAADAAADKGLITQRQHDEVIATKPGLGTGAKIALAAAALGGTYWIITRRRRSAHA